MIVHLWRGRDWDGRAFGKESKFVVGGRSGILKSRRVVFGEPVRDEVVDGRGFDDVARDNVSSNLACFLEEQDAKVLVAGFISQLFETYRCTETSRTCNGLSVLNELWGVGHVC